MHSSKPHLLCEVQSEFLTNILKKGGRFKLHVMVYCSFFVSSCKPSESLSTLEDFAILPAFFCFLRSKNSLYFVYVICFCWSWYSLTN